MFTVATTTVPFVVKYDNFNDARDTADNIAYNDGERVNIIFPTGEIQTHYRSGDLIMVQWAKL